MEKLFQGINNINIYESTLLRMENVIEKYEEYINLLSKLDERNLKYFLDVLMQREIVNNQKNENVNSLLSQLYYIKGENNSILYGLELIKQNKLYNMENLNTMHSITIKGTKDDIEKNHDYRKHDVKVMEVIDGVEIVQYIPPQPEDINKNMEVIVKYLNDKSTPNKNDIFLKPMISHALLAILQPFGNGNSRFARVISHIEMYKLTEEVYKKNFPSPLLYLSSSYLMYKKAYRRNIAKIATMQNDEAWNKWFIFNINMIEEQLNYNIDSLHTIIRSTKTR